MSVVATKEEMTQQLTFDERDYPNLSRYATVMKPPNRPIIGRKREMKRLLASLNRPELSNAFLIGDAGSGKTMLVQGTSVLDKDRLYLEIDLAKMAESERGEDGATQMASRIKGLFDEVLKFREETIRLMEKEQRERKKQKPLELVLFIDEFHLLVQLSPAGAQAIKPILADSGRRGVRIIGATTFDEFHQYVEQDQALMQRLQRINIHPPEKKEVIEILKSIAKSHGVYDEIYDKQLYELIYDYSTRYVPADSQPRKSILLLDSMIGWYKTFPSECKLNRKLLADVIYDSVGVRVAFNVDASRIEEELNKRVFAQEFAMKTIERRLQIAVADLHDKTRPISSFLFTGPTGVGKTETVKVLADLLFGDERAMIRFDMSEYALEGALDRFREELTSKVWNRPHSIILFDEIEKAHRNITRLLLQVLDDGRLSNAQGREVSFLNAYIVLTTNAGSEVYKDIAHYAQSDTGADGLAEYQKVIRRSLIANKSFAPEIINRMNAIVPFQPLSRQTFHNIVISKLIKFQEETKRIHGVDLKIHKDVADYLVFERHDEDTDSGGARGVVAQMETEVISAVSRFINQRPREKCIGVIVQGKMSHRDDSILKSQAQIKVVAIDPKKARRVQQRI